jgi:hypothetical protein
MTGPTVRLACAAAVLAAAGSAAAQPPIPGGAAALPPPAFSPYLNLARNGSFGLNYFGLVRPQIEARRAIFGLENQVQANRAAIANVQSGLAGGEFNLPATGHPTMFLNTGGYFLNSGGSFGGGRGGGGLGAGAGAGGAGFAPVGGLGAGGGSRMPTGLRPQGGQQPTGGQKR